MNRNGLFGSTLVLYLLFSLFPFTLSVNAASITLSWDRNDPEPLPVEGVLQSPETVLEHLNQLRQVRNRVLGGASDGAVDFGAQGGRHYEGHLDVLKEDLRRHWMQGDEVVILCESAGQQ